MKRIVSTLLILLCLCSLLTATVWANSPPRVEFVSNNSGLANYLIFVALSISITVLVEWSVGKAFHLKFVRKIIVINIISQIVLHILAFLLSLLFLSILVGSLPLNVIIVLEIFVIIAEWGYYCMTTDDISYGRLFVFSLCANCASVAAGLLLLQGIPALF